MPIERLQKIIAAAGVTSRRKAEELITSGRVQVNGKMVTELGTKADSEQDHIRVDGKLLRGPERHTYIVLNKPKGYVTTVSDPEKRPTVMDLVGGAKARVYPVGRLDWASEGLLLLTNDGELANALMKASSNVAKTYVVKVAGQPDEGKLDKLRVGVSIAEKGGRRVRTAPAKIRLIREADNPWLEVTIIEGRNRQVRKMFEEVGHHVEKIRRVKYGPLALDVPPGEFRSLTLEEVSRLKSAAAGTPMVRVPKPQMLPSEQPQGLKPSSKFANRSAEALRHPKAGVVRHLKAEATWRPKAKVTGHTQANAASRPKAEGQGRAPTKTAWRPKADAQGRDKAEGRRYPDANAQDRPNAKYPKRHESRAQGRPGTEAPRHPKAKTAWRPKAENRERGSSRNFDRSAAPSTSSGQASAAFRGAPRPPFRKRTEARGFEPGKAPDTPRRHFGKPGAGQSSATPRARRPFDKPSAGRTFATPSAGRARDSRQGAGATRRPPTRPRRPQP